MIKGRCVNDGGKRNGFRVGNPNGEGEVIGENLKKWGISGGWVR